MKCAASLEMAAVATALLLTSGCGSEPADSQRNAAPTAHATLPSGGMSSAPSVDPWAKYFMEGMPLKRFKTLADMVHSANVTVLGTVLSGSGGVSFADGSQKVELTLAVNELIAGIVNNRSETVSVEFGPYDKGVFGPELWQDLIGRQ